jgi:hypothetical protein
VSNLVPYRDLAKFGVITDIDPYDLPMGAWSFGVNVRFRNNKVSRGPVFRSVLNSISANPRFLIGYNPTSGVEQSFIGYLNGSVSSLSPAGATDVSIGGYVPSSAEGTWTSAHLADLLYINREDRVPWYLPSGMSQFATLPNWGSNWRAKIIRASNSSLLAFNITEGAAAYPTKIRTSTFALAGTVPASWDETLPNTDATSNELADMEGEIVDALPLRNDVYIYGARETWWMQFVGGQDIWDYRKVFDAKGAINANCSVEVNGRHYVFGEDDLWMHDGITPVSIADNRVRDFVFSSIDLSRKYRCFVTHNPQLKEINFCFVSGDAYVAFNPLSATGYDGCNRQAVYNYVNDSWTFDDLPYIYSASRCNVDSTLQWSTDSATWATQGGSWQDTSNSTKRPLCYVGDANSSLGLSNSWYAFDLYGPGSIAPWPVDPVATAGVTLARDGIDLDELGIDLPGYKVLNSLYPQGRIEIGGQPMTFKVGASDYFTVNPSWDDPQTYDAATFYKLDYNMGGRWLSLLITYPDYKVMTLTGIDLDLQVTGER